MTRPPRGKARKASAAKRPPRKVWIVLGAMPVQGCIGRVYLTRAAAKDWVERFGGRLVEAPYAQLERVRER